MKNNESKSVCVYRNLEHEQSTKHELETARQILQRFLELWDSLDIGICTDIGGLLMRTEKAYNNAIEKLVEVPESKGRFAVKKESLIDTLELPDPSQLYATAKAIRQQPYCASLELWGIEGSEVILNESEAEILIDSQSIYANQPDKIALVKDLNKFCKLYNSLNKRLNGELLQANPWTFNHFRGMFVLQQKSYDQFNEIEPELEFLRRISQASL